MSSNFDADVRMMAADDAVKAAHEAIRTFDATHFGGIAGHSNPWDGERAALVAAMREADAAWKAAEDTAMDAERLDAANDLIRHMSHCDYCQAGVHCYEARQAFEDISRY